MVIHIEVTWKTWCSLFLINCSLTLYLMHHLAFLFILLKVSTSGVMTGIVGGPQQEGHDQPELQGAG